MVDKVKEWWDRLSLSGPSYGYFPNSKKTTLLVKEKYLKDAATLFSGSNINIVTSGQPCWYRIICISSRQGSRMCNGIRQPAEIAAAYSAFLHGISSKWIYFSEHVQLIHPY